MSVLSLRRVGHAYLGRTVIEDVSLGIAAGEIVALVGPSGCGKSTLAHIAAGLIAPRAGRVEKRYRRHAMIFQEPRLMPWRTARGNIAYALQRAGWPRPARPARIDAVAAQVALEQDDLAKYPSELSGGMKQRVAIARALAPQPDFVFFDEPFTALDVALRQRMQDIVIAASDAANLAGLFITHDLTEAARVADRIAVLHPLGRGILGMRDVPGLRGARSGAMLFDWVQHALSGDPLFRHIHDVDERRLA